MKIPFKNSVLSWMLKKRVHQMDFFLKYPIDVQREVLFSLLSKAENTSFGQEHHFSSICTYEDFCQQVPVRNYEELFPYIKRIRNNESNILWPGQIKWFAKSSGTTNAESKFIPVSEEALHDCHYKAGKDMLAIYCNNQPETKLFDGKALVLGGSKTINGFTNYMDGDLSAILLDNSPFWISIHQTPDLHTALLPNWEEKLDSIIAQSIHENVTSLTGALSWILLILNRVLAETKAKNILEVWPNLELYMHGGMSFVPYKSQLEQLIPKKDMTYLECYNASEGFFAIQDSLDHKEMLLMLDYGIFYEFIPIEDLRNKERKTICLNKVELHKIYAMVITTNAGLWRYLIGDTIKFTSINPFRIQIVGRTKSFINAFGEELMVENAENAIAFACDKTNAKVKEFIAAPLYIESGKSGAHQWLIEFEIQPNCLTNFTLHLDDFLQKVNTDYKAKRTNNLILKTPIVESVKNNTFYNWQKTKGKLGGQSKIPRLCNDRIILEDILSTMRSN